MMDYTRLPQLESGLISGPMRITYCEGCFGWSVEYPTDTDPELINALVSGHFESCTQARFVYGKRVREMYEARHTELVALVTESNRQLTADAQKREKRERKVIRESNPQIFLDPALPYVGAITKGAGKTVAQWVVGGLNVV